MEISRLNLRTPLYYVPLADADPFVCREGAERDSGGEQLFCFELDEAQYMSFEPDKRTLLGTLVFGGEAGKGGSQRPGEARENRHELPGGNYLFAQKREILGRDDIIAMAVEIQQECLWQRLEPGKALYLRYLVEDSSGVTQIFRPYSGSGED